MSKSASERFQGELKNINSYVSYIENNFYHRSCSVIRTQGYEDLGALSNYVFWADEKEEKEANKYIIDSLKEIVDDKITELEAKLSQMQRVEVPEMSEKIIEKGLAETLSFYIECEVYDCMENPEKLPAFELVQTILPVELKREIDKHEETQFAPEERCYDVLTEEDYASALQHIGCKMYNEEVDFTENELKEYEELKTLYNVFDEEDPICIYRQAFILLMTAFDAAVFDLFSNVFNQNFFDLAPFVSYDKKFTLGDITKFRDFSEFAASTIDTMIAGKYVSDIIEILHNYKPELFTIQGEFCFDTIMEMIQRRNLHVHKNGIVDEKYFTKGNGSKLGIRIGEYAIIDNIYYNRVSELLDGFVQNLKEGIA